MYRYVKSTTKAISRDHMIDAISEASRWFEDYILDKYELFTGTHPDLTNQSLIDCLCTLPDDVLKDIYYACEEYMYNNDMTNLKLYDKFTWY